MWYNQISGAECASRACAVICMAVISAPHDTTHNVFATTFLDSIETHGYFKINSELRSFSIHVILYLVKDEF